MISKPPPVLDSANVLEFAVLGSSVIYTGKVSTSMNFEVVENVPCLAICQNEGEDDYYLFYCDSSWEVLAAGGGESVEKIKAIAEKGYSGSLARWCEYV